MILLWKPINNYNCQYYSLFSYCTHHTKKALFLLFQYFITMPHLFWNTIKKMYWNLSAFNTEINFKFLRTNFNAIFSFISKNLWHCQKSMETLKQSHFWKLYDEYKKTLTNHGNHASNIKNQCTPPTQLLFSHLGQIEDYLSWPSHSKNHVEIWDPLLKPIWVTEAINRPQKSLNIVVNAIFFPNI